jgi:hypothetical protein
MEPVMYGAAVNWVRAECISPELARQTAHFLNACSAAGLDCSFVVGGALTRSGNAGVLNCFAGEVFVHQLTDAQAAAMGVARDGTCCTHSNKRSQVMRPPPRVALSLGRLEMLGPTLTPTTPIVGRLEYQLLGGEPEAWCLRLDYSLGQMTRVARDFRQPPLWGKGVLDIAFESMAAVGPVPPGLKGPAVMFARIIELSRPNDLGPGCPVSNAAAAMVEVV